jgi:hypothetical protein
MRESARKSREAPLNGTRVFDTWSKSIGFSVDRLFPMGSDLTENVIKG